MALPLPNLDDRRWVDLVDEGRAFVLVYAPEWTDHNVHDPGITLIELLAWIAETDIYRVNRVPQARRRKFLELIGVTPKTPAGAAAIAAFHLRWQPKPIELPRGTELVEVDSEEAPPLRFRTTRASTLFPATLEAIQVGEDTPARDLSAAAQRRDPILPFGEEPRTGASLYLGFEFPRPSGDVEPTTLAVHFIAPRPQRDERSKFDEAAADARVACLPADHRRRCLPQREDDSTRGDPAPEPDAVGELTAQSARLHHSAELTWEVRVAGGHWRPLDGATVNDETRALTLGGRITLALPADIERVPLGRVEAELYYLRCRLAGGSYDRAPVVEDIVVNGVEVEQVVPVATRLRLAAGATVSGPLPHPGDVATFRLQLDSSGSVSRLHFGVDDVPAFRVLEYIAPTPAEDGALHIEAAFLGRGSGVPSQTIELADIVVAGSSFRLFSLENNRWRSWLPRLDFAASTRADAHYVLDLTDSTVRFGDGERGRVVPDTAPLFAVYDFTAGESGNVGAQRALKVPDDSHNGALFGANLPAVLEQVESIATAVPAVGGRFAESFDAAAGRAVELVASSGRAVTVSDYEALARETPGVDLARVKAVANVHPSFPCSKAPGVITVAILPYLPASRPQPSRGLLRAVATYLTPRRALGTRIEVIGPAYVEVAVRARVQACRGVGLEALAERARTALDDLFHPLTGGPDGEGWPFGRDVYRSEVLQAIAETPGADHVLFLEFVDKDGRATCGNACVPPLGLVASGDHEIEVVREGV